MNVHGSLRLWIRLGENGRSNGGGTSERAGHSLHTPAVTSWFAA
jgi:hypothetical protein